MFLGISRYESVENHTEDLAWIHQQREHLPIVRLPSWHGDGSTTDAIFCKHACDVRI